MLVKPKNQQNIKRKRRRKEREKKERRKEKENSPKKEELVSGLIQLEGNKTLSCQLCMQPLAL